MLSCSALGERMPDKMVFGYGPDLSRLIFFGSQAQIYLSPQEWEGELADRTRAGRYAGHDDSGSTCMLLNEKMNRLFHRVDAFTSIFKCHKTANEWVPDSANNYDSFTDQFVVRGLSWNQCLITTTPNQGACSLVQQGGP